MVLCIEDDFLDRRQHPAVMMMMILHDDDACLVVVVWMSLLFFKIYNVLIIIHTDTNKFKSVCETS